MGTVDEPTPFSHRGPAVTTTGLRPVVLSSEWHRGERTSRVLRPDGSTFTVTVPRLGMDERIECLVPQHPWISDDTGRPDLSTTGFVRLASVAGVAWGG
jgi:hypothetical protein